MTGIFTLRELAEEQMPGLLEDKDDPDAWYVLKGAMAVEYSVWADEELPEDYEEFQEEMPPQDRDANPNAEGFMQIGTAGWTSDAFDFDGDGDGFVSEVQWGDKVQRNLLNLLLVHEDVLSEEAIAHAEGRKEAEA